MIAKPIFVRPVDLGTWCAGNAVPGHSAFHLARHKAAGLTWKSNGNGNLWLRGDFGQARPIDFAAILSANAGANTNIRLRLGSSQSDVDGGGADYDSGQQSFIDPAVTIESGLYHSHQALDAPVSARWWRIDVSGHAGDFEASMLVLGQRIEPSRLYNYAPEHGADDTGEIDITADGVIDETRGRVLRTVAFTLAWQSREEYETKFRPMIEAHGTREPLYLCFDPTPNAYRQNNTLFGFLRKIPETRGSRKPETFIQDYQMRSILS